MGKSQGPSPAFQAFKRNERNGFEHYRDLLEDELYRFVLAIVLRTDEAEDIVADAFLLLWYARGVITDEGHLRGWLYNTARKLALKSLEKRKKQLDGEAGFVRTQQEMPAITEEAWTEGLIKLAADIEKLSPQRKKVFDMRYLKNMKVKLIALLLGLSEQTVRNEANEARKGLGGKKDPRRLKKNKKNSSLE